VFPLKDNIPTERFPAVTVALIVVNVLMYFLFQKGGLSLGDPGGLEYQCNVVEYGAIPFEITHPGEQVAFQECERPEASTYLTVLTSMFMHGGLLLLGGYILLFPRARVVTVIFIVFFFTIVQLPALLILGFWFVQQIAFGYYGLNAGGGEEGGVAYFAHIGGFVFGLLLIKAFASEQRRQRQIERIGLT
jgi:membrane associated rhomboid family serine protease